LSHADPEEGLDGRLLSVCDTAEYKTHVRPTPVDLVLCGTDGAAFNDCSPFIHGIDASGGERISELLELLFPDRNLLQRARGFADSAKMSMVLLFNCFLLSNNADLLPPFPNDSCGPPSNTTSSGDLNQLFEVIRVAGLEDGRSVSCLQEGVSVEYVLR
jgi:hypothetical protein